MIQVTKSKKRGKPCAVSTTSSSFLGRVEYVCKQTNGLRKLPQAPAPAGLGVAPSSCISHMEHGPKEIVCAFDRSGPLLSHLCAQCANSRFKPKNSSKQELAKFKSIYIYVYT